MLIEVTPQTKVMWVVTFKHPRDGHTEVVEYHSKTICESFLDWLDSIGVKFTLSLKLSS